MDSTTFNGDFMVRLWRLSDNLNYHVFSMKTPDKLQTSFTIKLHKKESSSPDCLHTISILTILVVRFTIFFHKSLRQITKFLHIRYAENTFFQC